MHERRMPEHLRAAPAGEQALRRPTRFGQISPIEFAPKAWHAAFKSRSRIVRNRARAAIEREEPSMNAKRSLLSTAAAAGFAALLAAPSQVTAQTAVAIDNDDIGGVVSGPNGPEAGVWVIAETKDTPTRYAKMVVTDDQGRYVVPDLPKGNYKVWVRGYGLVDSPKVQSEPGKIVNLTAVKAPNPSAAAQYY